MGSDILCYNIKQKVAKKKKKDEKEDRLQVMCGLVCHTEEVEDVGFYSVENGYDRKHIKWE